MAGTIMSSSFSKDLLPGVQQFFGDYKPWETKFDKYFDVMNVTERYQEDVIKRGLTLATVKPEGQAVQYDTMSQGWTKRYEQVVYATGFVITREAKDDGHALNLAKEGAQSLKRAMMQTKEVIAANVLNRAITAGYTGGDGVVLASTAHPTYAGGNLANRMGTDADFSEASLEQALIDIHAFVDERGLKVYYNPRKIVIPTALEYDVVRVLQNPNRPGTADRDINATHALGVLPEGYVVVPWLTDSDAWTIITDCPKGLRFLVRNEMEVTDDSEFDTENAKFKGRMRLVAGWTDPRGVYYSAGA